MGSLTSGTAGREDASLPLRVVWVTERSAPEPGIGTRTWSRAVRGGLAALGLRVDIRQAPAVAGFDDADLVVLDGPQRVQAAGLGAARLVTLLPNLGALSSPAPLAVRADIARRLQESVAASDAVIVPSDLMRDTVERLLRGTADHATRIHVLHGSYLERDTGAGDATRDGLYGPGGALPVFMAPASGSEADSHMLRRAFDQLVDEANLLLVDRDEAATPPWRPGSGAPAGFIAVTASTAPDPALLGSAAAGIAAIVPDTPLFREVTAGHAVFYEPGSVDQLVTGVRRVLRAAPSVEPARLALQARSRALFGRDADRQLARILRAIGLDVAGPVPAEGRPEAAAAVSEASGAAALCSPVPDAGWAGRQPTIALLVVPGSPDLLALTLASIRGQRHPPAQVLVATRASPPPLDEVLPGRRASLLNATGMAEGHVRATLVELAEADYVAFLEPGDVLAPGALGEMVEALRPGFDLVHSDEEVDPASGLSSHALALKPGWSPELLRAYNYFGRLTILRRSLARQEVWRTALSGDAQEWDLNLRCIDRGAQVRRLPRVLCRRSPASTLDRPPPEDARSADHRAVLHAYWHRHGHEATVVTQRDGTQHATWPIADTPLVSIIIPSRDKPDLIKTSVKGLLERTTYPKLDLIIVDNFTSDPEVLEFYETLEADGHARIVTYNRPFNYSAACNAGAAVARGSLLLFLNNDIDVIRPDWLDELVRPALEPGVGVVGTMLVYPDGSLQHAGVVVGMHLCGLIFRAAPIEGWGLFGSPSVPRNYLAVMGACQLIRRDVFKLIGGFDETYRLCNSDVALSVQAWRAGYRTVYTPHARLTHREGASRGPGNPWEDMNRTAANLRELGIVEDPYFHPLLSPHVGIPTLRRDDEPTSAANFVADVARLFEETPAPTRLDLHSDGDAMAATGCDRDTLFWPPQDPAGIADPWAAARYAIDLLRGREELRQRFPLALSAGTASRFFAWLTHDGCPRLPERARAAMSELFGSDLGRRVQHVLLSDEHVRRTMPLGGTPTGHREFLRWLFAEGADRHRLRPEEIWWFALSRAEDPGAQVVARHLFTPAWQQAFPAGATVFGHGRLAAWLAQAFHLDASWLDPSRWRSLLPAAEQVRLAYLASDLWRRRHPDALHSAEAAGRLLDWLTREDSVLNGVEQTWLAALDRTELAETLAVRGVTLLGAFAAGQADCGAESLARCLERQGVRVARRDAVRDTPGPDPALGERRLFPALEAYPVTIVHARPDEPAHEAYRRAGLEPRRPAAYRILFHDGPRDAVPQGGPELARGYDEIWTADAADGLEALDARPILHVPLDAQGGAAARQRLDRLADVLAGGLANLEPARPATPDHKVPA